MQLGSLYKIKTFLKWSGLAVTIGGMGLGAVLLAQKLTKTDTAPIPSQAEQNACYLEFNVEGEDIPLSGRTYCVIKDTKEKLYIGNIPIRLIQDTNGDGTQEQTVIATSDSSGNWSYAKSSSSWTNPIASLRPNGGEEFPYASATDAYTKVDNGILCEDSNVEGISFNSDKTAIIETNGCMRQSIPINAVNFNLGYCPTQPPPEELACTSLTASPATGNFPLTVNFTAAATNASLAVRYRFVFGDGNTQESTAPTISHTYTTAGTYSASVSISDSQGNWTSGPAACQKTITVTAPPEELACSRLTASVTSGDYPLNVQFTGQASNPSLVNMYRFIFGDGTQVDTTSSIITHTYQTAGTFTATVSMRNAAGVWTPATAACRVTITVTTPPPPPPPEELTCVRLMASPTTGNFPLSASFTATSSNPLLVSVYRFIFGDGQQVDTTLPATSHTYQYAGTYNARVTMRDLEGNWTSDIPACRVAITVTTPPPPPETFDCQSLTANITSGNTPLSVNFTARATVPSRAESYKFHFGDSSSDVTTANSTVTHIYTTSGSYEAYVIIKDSQDGWTDQSAVCTLKITPVTPPVVDDLVCNDVCDLNNDQCPSGTKCIGLGTANLCRNPSCSGNSNCVCDTTKTVETPSQPVAQTPAPIQIPETGRVGDTLKVIGAGILLILASLII